MASHSSFLAWRIHGQRKLVGTVHRVADPDMTEGTEQNQAKLILFLLLGKL